MVNELQRETGVRWSPKVGSKEEEKCKRWIDPGENVTELEGWLTAAAGSWQERLQLSAAQEHGSWDGLHSGGAKVWYACAYAYVCLGVWETGRLWGLCCMRGAQSGRGRGRGVSFRRAG